MIYVFGLLVSLLIVSGQVLWKAGLERTAFVFSKKSVLTWDFLGVLLSPYIIAGVLSYAIATVLFMALLSKFEYTSLQAIVVSSSLMFTFIAAAMLFNEKIALINLLGLFFLLIGVILVTKF
jgi:drug/metabolite transporter (DMT)-like permease